MKHSYNNKKNNTHRKIWERGGGGEIELKILVHRLYLECTADYEIVEIQDL